MRLAKEHARRLTGLPSLSSSDDGTTSNNDNAPLTVDAYAKGYYHRFGDLKGKSPTRKW